MDESGFEAETIRPYGYAPIGKPCIDSYNWQGKKRTNVIGALYEKMLFALDYFETNINSIVLVPVRTGLCQPDAKEDGEYNQIHRAQIQYAHKRKCRQGHPDII